MATHLMIWTKCDKDIADIELQCLKQWRCGNNNFWDDCYKVCWSTIEKEPQLHINCDNHGKKYFKADFLGWSNPFTWLNQINCSYCCCLETVRSILYFYTWGLKVLRRITTFLHSWFCYLWLPQIFSCHAASHKTTAAMQKGINELSNNNNKGVYLLTVYTI